MLLWYNGQSPTAAACAEMAWGSRSTLGLLHGLSLKKMKLGAATFISGEVDGVGKQQLASDNLQQLVGAILLFLSFFFLLFLSASPFPSPSLLSFLSLVLVRECERE